MSPPIQGVAIHVRIPTATLAALDRVAKRDGITRAELLRRIASEYLERNV